MINLYTYISPVRKLDDMHQRMIEVQIDNSLEYWNPKDIVFAANFPFEYHGIKSIVIPDLMNSQYPANPRAVINSKVNVIIYLLKNKIINDLAWYHDFDSFQVAPLNLKLEKDMGVTCYGVYPRWIFYSWGKNAGRLGQEPQATKYGFPRRINFGNVFFKPGSLDIFERLLEKMDSESLYEEDAMTLLLEDGEFLDRVDVMNPTYNINIRCTKNNVKLADKPIRIVHFPPNHAKWYYKFRKYLTPNLRKLSDEKFIDLHQPGT